MICFNEIELINVLLSKLKGKLFHRVTHRRHKVTQRKKNCLSTSQNIFSFGEITEHWKSNTFEQGSSNQTE